MASSVTNMTPFRCLLFLLVIHLVTSSNPYSYDNCKCGKLQLKSRIVGGRVARPHSMPWIAAITKFGNTHCGGALISDRHILTAGHCVKWDRFENFDVLLGLQDMNDRTGVVSRKVVKATLHPSFTSTDVRDDNDIAMLTLAQPVQFNRNIYPVCLPTTHPSELFGTQGIIAGWGRVGSKAKASPELLEAKVSILADYECENTALSSYLTHNMMCAQAKGTDGCQGDSGGPMVQFNHESGKFEIIGVVSWGFGCADPRYPGVYTKVANYLDWIEMERRSGNTCAAI